MKAIDLVIPMVFPDDKEWQKDYARSHGNADGAQNGARFRSWKTEELLIKCCKKYMPWVRTIHILLARESQVQGWMKSLPPRTNEPTIHLVYHREFIPAELLPCFNVNTIEMWLHKIPGLSEHFIYSNDDFFPLSPLEPTDFFRPAGEAAETETEWLPCQHHDEKPYPTAPNTFQRFVKNGLDMVAADWGKRFPSTWLKGGHSMQPMLKSTVEEVCQRHADRINQSFSLGREAKNFNQYIFPFYQHLSGKYIDHVPNRRYVGPKVPTSEVADILRNSAVGVVCLNDNRQITDWKERAAIVREEIAAKLEADPSTTDPREGEPAGKAAGTLAAAMDVLIVHYNSQELTEAAIKSLWKYHPEARVTVFDNSDKRPFVPAVKTAGALTVIDNTKGQIVDWEKWLAQYKDKKNTTANNWASAKHCYSVELCMDRFPNGFVLMDSDVLVKRDISDIIDREMACVGEVSKPVAKFPIPRLMPMLCWINTPMLKEHGIRYFNAEKMWKLTSKHPENLYDTGAWLLEAVKTAGLPQRTIAMSDYILHLGSGSWTRKKNPLKWLEEHREMWAAAVATGESDVEESGTLEAEGTLASEEALADNTETTRIYICTHADFKPIVSNPVYEVVDARTINGGHCENGLRQSFYSELFHFKHIAEREDLPKYVGVCHYRRYFSFMDEVPNMDALFKEYDAITTTPIVLKRSVRGQYARCHNVKDLDIVSEIIWRDYPDLWPTYKKSMERPTLYACNMMIMKREDFRWLVKTVFEIFEKYLVAITSQQTGTGADGADLIEQRIMAHPQDYHIGRPQTGTVQYQYRIAAFLSERIINALISYRFKRVKHYEKVLTAECLPQQVVLCGIGRMENRYAREWVDYHLAKGFNRVIIYDNNRDGEERFEEVLQDYIDDGRVEVIDYRNRDNAQIMAYNDCYHRYGNLYEWIAFLDFDEFLVTDKPVHEFLSEYRHTDCLLLNWRVMTDSGRTRYEPIPLRERFTVPLANDVLMHGKYRYNDHVKSIVRGGLQVTKVFGGQMPHVPKAYIRCCNVAHQQVENSPFQPCDHSRAWIDHYTTKTIEEWLEVKYKRGFPVKITKQWREEWAIPQFFEINERTSEKEEVLKEWERRV